jgi:hypothetical protein
MPEARAQYLDQANMPGVSPSMGAVLRNISRSFAGLAGQYELLIVIADEERSEAALIQPIHDLKDELYCRAQEESPMSRLATAFLLTFAAAAANGQDTKSQQPQAPATTSADEGRPFLFDGRMVGDGRRQNAPAGNKHPNAGAIVPSDKKAN